MYQKLYTCMAVEFLSTRNDIGRTSLLVEIKWKQNASQLVSTLTKCRLPVLVFVLGVRMTFWQRLLLICGYLCYFELISCITTINVGKCLTMLQI